MEKLTLGPNKVELFLQAANEELQEKLEVLLEDKEEEEGFTPKFSTQRVVQVIKIPMPTRRLTMPIVQPPLAIPKKEDMGLEEIVRSMRDLQIKLARLEEKTSTISSKVPFKQGYIQRYIWCDDDFHSQKDCGEFNEMVQQGIVYWKDGKIALKDTSDLLQTNFGKRGMKALVKDYLSTDGIAAIEASSYGTRVDNNGK
uniref:Predicted protein n=1 Tax=Physcomitrium patens TaxID=3218 RepID=A9U1B7_PHYPA